MSDFDEEAERERLREQFERDKRKREASERMSELLLKGATMTNKHCDTCGDPVFRYQGQEFCPTCQQPTSSQDQAGQREAGQGQAGQEQTGEPQGDQQPPGQHQGDAQPGQQPDEAAEQPTGARPDPERPAVDMGADGSDVVAEPEAETPDDERPSTGANAASGSEPSFDPTEHVDPDARRPTPTERGDRGGRETWRQDRTAARRTGRGPNGDAGSSTGGDLGSARDSLVRTITEMAEKAETTDDVARKREYLAAAREAAEALAAANQVA